MAAAASIDVDVFVRELWSKRQTPAAVLPASGIITAFPPFAFSVNLMQAHVLRLPLLICAASQPAFRAEVAQSLAVEAFARADIV